MSSDNTGTFNGFGPGKTRTTKIPSQFFSELLPAIDDLGELKVTLYVFWVLQQQEGEFRYLRERDLLGDEVFLGGFDPDPEAAAQQVRDGLARAQTRGTLLHATVAGVNGPEELYFLNTVRGRNALRAIEQGQFEPGDRDHPVGLVAERPNIFALYEQNIGPLTPMIADELGAAERDYPAEWIEDAIKLAVERNKRSWRYAAGILKRWQAEGKDSGLTKRPTQADRYRYVQGEFSDNIDY